MTELVYRVGQPDEKNSSECLGHKSVSGGIISLGITGGEPIHRCNNSKESGGAHDAASSLWG